jgi:hypothetical protein
MPTSRGGLRGGAAGEEPPPENGAETGDPDPDDRVVVPERELERPLRQLRTAEEDGRERVAEQRNGPYRVERESTDGERDLIPREQESRHRVHRDERDGEEAPDGVYRAGHDREDRGEGHREARAADEQQA